MKSGTKNEARAFLEMEMHDQLTKLIEAAITSIREIDIKHGVIIMIGEEYCPNCDAIKELYREEMGENWITYYDSESDEGRKFVELFDIQYVPFIIFQDTRKNMYWECEWTASIDGEYEIHCPFKNGREINA